jgi:hypothetical protein
MFYALTHECCNDARSASAIKIRDPVLRDGIQYSMLVNYDHARISTSVTRFSQSYLSGDQDVV